MMRLATCSVVLTALAWCTLAIAGMMIAPAYLAMWLAFLAVPVGALPLVMGMELCGHGSSRSSGYLRWLLVLMPAAALCGVPLVVFLHSLYPWARHAIQPGFAGAWFTPMWFGIRGVTYLAIWSALAVLLMRPPDKEAAARTGLCVIGLCLHVSVATLAANDWIMSLAPGLNSGLFGLLFVAMQSGIAICVALLLVTARPLHAVPLLMIVASTAAMLSLLQYLVVWSANRPGEIVWYLHREGVFGRGLTWFGVFAVCSCVLLLGPARWSRWRPAVPGCAALLLAALVCQMLWLVTPSVRGAFVLPAADVATLLVSVLLVAGMIWLLQPPRVAS